MRIQVKDFMSSPVLTATAKNTIGEIRKLMKEKKIHAIPIVQYKKQLPELEVVIKGIITASDLNDRIKNNRLVKEFMTKKLHVIHKDSSAKVAANMMIKHDVHHLVAMENGLVIGMISSLDFVKLVAEHALD